MKKFFDVLWVIVVVICIGIVVTGNDARVTNKIKGFITNISFAGDAVTPLDISNAIPEEPVEEKKVFPKRVIVEMHIAKGGAGKYDYFWYEAELVDNSSSEKALATYSIVRLIAPGDGIIPAEVMSFYKENEKDLIGIKELGHYTVKVDIGKGNIVKLRASGSSHLMVGDYISTFLEPEDIAK